MAPRIEDSMSDHPNLLLVEDTESDAFVAQALARVCGWSSQWKRSIYDAWQWSIETLRPERPLPPTVILIDMRMPDQYFLKLEGSVLATWLSEEMSQGRLQPAPIVGISTDVNAHRSWEAQVAGCRALFNKPLTQAHFQQFREFLQSAPAAAEDPDIDTLARDIIRRQHLDIMENVIHLHNQGKQTRYWNSQEVRVLLSALTHSVYCPREMQAAREDILGRIGGASGARKALMRSLSSPEMSSLQVKIVNRLLNGVSQEQIARQEGIGRRGLEHSIEEALIKIAAILSEHQETP
jgi:CheY-like chemotaxis protein